MDELFDFYECKEQNRVWVNPQKTNCNASVCDCGGELQETDDVKICSFCSARYPIFQAPSRNAEDEFEGYTPYQPLVHFKEILQNYQGKESIRNASNVLEKIKEQLVKERIEPKDASYNQIKFILKKLKMQTQYEHIFFYLNALGVEIPYFTLNQEEQLILMFNQLVQYYHEFVPEKRKSFLNYHYCLRAMCLQMGWTEQIKDIPTLTDESKKREHNQIFEKICRKIDWKFYPLY